MAATRICFPDHQGAFDKVDSSGVAYDIRVGEPPEDASRLGVAIVPRAFGNSPARLERHEIKTPSLLRTQNASLHLPAQLLAYQEDLASITSDMIGTASIWFERRLLSSLKMVEADIVNSLYTYFRSLLPTPLRILPSGSLPAIRRCLSARPTYCWQRTRWEYSEVASAGVMKIGIADRRCPASTIFNDERRRRSKPDRRSPDHVRSNRGKVLLICKQLRRQMQARVLRARSSDGVFISWRSSRAGLLPNARGTMATPRREASSGGSPTRISYATPEESTTRSNAP